MKQEVNDVTVFLLFLLFVGILVAINTVQYVLSLMNIPKDIKDKIQFIRSNKVKRVEGDVFILKENCSRCGGEMTTMNDKKMDVYKRCSQYPNCNNNTLIQKGNSSSWEF